MTNPNPPTHWALAAAVTEEFLNHLAAEAIGPGLPPNELRQEFNIPMLGPVDLTVRLQIVSVRFTMRAEDEGKLRATIGARGEVEFNGDMAMPPLPGAAIVNGEVLVDPIVEFKPSGRFRAVLDLKNSQLIGMGFEGFEGVDTDADMAAQMGNMLFAAVGGELFEALAAGMDTTGLELEPSEGQYLSELGVAFGSAEFAIEDGLMTVGLPALPGVEGRAEPTPVFGHRLGVAIAAGALTSLVNQLASQQLGMDLPFDLDVLARNGHLGGRLRNQRLVESEVLPDLRPSLRSTLTTQLTEDAIEIRLREAWVELPFVPPILNKAQRYFGGLASALPAQVRVPRTLQLKPHEDGAEVDLRVASFDVAREGVNIVIDAAVVP